MSKTQKAVSTCRGCGPDSEKWLEQVYHMFMFNDETSEQERRWRSSILTGVQMQFCSWFPCTKLISPRCPVHHICSVLKRFVNAVQMQWSDTNLNADVSSSLVSESSQNQEDRLDYVLIIRKYYRNQNVQSTGPKLIHSLKLEGISLRTFFVFVLPFVFLSSFLVVNFFELLVVAPFSFKILLFSAISMCISHFLCFWALVFDFPSFSHGLFDFLIYIDKNYTVHL